MGGMRRTRERRGESSSIVCAEGTELAICRDAGPTLWQVVPEDLSQHLVVQAENVLQLRFGETTLGCSDVAKNMERN